MNDHELDALLNTWKPPEPSARMRERVRGGFRARFPYIVNAPLARRWLGSFAQRAGALAALLVMVIALTKAAPLVLSHSPGANAAYIMETETSVYGRDGQVKVEVFSAAYDKDAREISYSRSVPDNALGTFGERIAELHRALFVYVHGERVDAGVPSAAALRGAGCAVVPVVGRETILNYPTVAVRVGSEAGRRRTAWLAPDLGCLELRYTSEVAAEDGTWRMAKRSQAVKVIVH